MAKARALDKRRKSVRNIHRITRTMELIATAQFRRAMERAMAAATYTDRITMLVGHMAHAGLEVSHPLLETCDEPQRATLLVLTANGGMCGGYNSGVLRRGNARLEELRESIPQIDIEVSGKRGISSFRFRKIAVNETFTHFEDKPTFEEVNVVADRYLEAFEAGKLDRLDVAYMKFESLSRQTAVVETLLPLSELATAGADDAEAPTATELAATELAPTELAAIGREYEFLPSPRSILDEVVPTSFRVKLFKCFLDAAVGEQIARMVAMKAATENAASMISHLAMVYNRARQGQITSELLEVISGADALSG